MTTSEFVLLDINTVI